MPEIAESALPPRLAGVGRSPVSPGARPAADDRDLNGLTDGDATAEPPAPAPWTGPFGAGAAWLTGALTSMRHARLIGRSGSAYRAQLEITPGSRRLRSPLFDRPGVYDITLRVSRAVGVPDPLPDLLGLAIKIPAANGPGRDQDLLLFSSASGPLARQTAVPATSFLGRRYSTISPYLVGGRPLMFGAVASRRVVYDGGTALAELDVAAITGNLSFELQVATPVGRWRSVGVIRVGAGLNDAEADAIRFNPWNTGPTILPFGIADAIRRPAYLGAQKRRP